MEFIMLPIKSYLDKCNYKNKTYINIKYNHFYITELITLKYNIEQLMKVYITDQSVISINQYKENINNITKISLDINYNKSKSTK
jgi:hypothetical protein